jgi:hypothetical protein
MKNDDRAKLIADILSSPRGRRRLAWDMIGTFMGGRDRPVLWEGYPDSPTGTLEPMEEQELEWTAGTM